MTVSTYMFIVSVSLGQILHPEGKLRYNKSQGHRVSFLRDEMSDNKNGTFDHRIH